MVIKFLYTVRVRIIHIFKPVINTLRDRSYRCYSRSASGRIRSINANHTYYTNDLRETRARLDVAIGNLVRDDP